MGLTSEQLESRKYGIGGSDAGAAIGVNPYKTPLELWLEKTGKNDPEDLSDNNYVRWGEILEDVVADEYSRVTGYKLRKTSKTKNHKDYPFILANIDRLIVNSNGLLEIKTANIFADGWGEPGTDQVPVMYKAQCWHYMAVYDRDWCDLAVLIGGNDFRIYRIERDLEIEKRLIEEEVKFWELVIYDIPPEPVSFRDLAKRWPDDNGESIEADAVVLNEIEKINECKAKINELTETMKLAESSIKRYMEGCSELVNSNGTPLATWKTQESKRIDVKKLRKEMPEVADGYTITNQTRVFRLKTNRGGKK